MATKTLCAAALFISLPLIVSSPARANQQKSSANDPAPRVIKLWPKGAPGATGDSEEDTPAIIPYLPAADKNTGAGVLICPGGAFTNRAVNHEGVLIAQWLKARGVAGFVLRYRIRPLYTPDDSTQDALRGLRYLRANAAEFRLDPNRIGIIGFSAGAELATFTVFKAVPARPEAEDPIDRMSSRADFMILAYGSSPIPASLNTNEAPIPPTFMFCTAEDIGHLRGMTELYAGLVRARVPAEAHFFVNGEHYARKRDLSPNIEAQRVYRRKRPTDKDDFVVEIKAGAENRLHIEVFSR